MEIIASIDPVTRLEGHLKVELTIDKVNGVQQVVDARTTGGLFRGFENILVGRDPRDAQHITERICGVCPVAHGMAAVRALDTACGVTITVNARLMRNLVNGANFVESHILHFFLLAALDFVEGPGMPPWKVDWQRDRRFSKSVNDLLVSHYVKAIEMRRKAHEMAALFGGKMPHPPAFIAGGFTANPRPERIAAFQSYLNELIPFITNVYLPDVELLAATYPDYFSIGRGPGNLLAFGVFDQNASGSSKLLAGGHAAGGSRAVQALDPNAVTEAVTYSWFNDTNGAIQPANEGTTAQSPKRDAYSWLKAPRYNTLSCEVGPLARMWVNGDYQNGISVMDRHRARAAEALKIANAMQGWLTQLNPTGGVYVQPTIPTAATSYGLTEAPRGALGHWLNIAGGKIAGYQIISPTTWNCSPRDEKGLLGALEDALVGTAVENADEPIEALRIIHSFDPCLDCAAHVIRPGRQAKVIHIGA
jgi:hydrogenase large subunit